MQIEKLNSFLRLRGINVEDNFLIQIEKIRYLYFRCLEKIKLKEKNSYSLGQGLKKPVIAKAKGKFYCRENSLDLHIISESYEFKVKKAFENIAIGSKTIVDVGANIGRYTILGGIVNPTAKIYSIEPEQKNFEILSKNVGLNNLKNINLIKIALGNKNGTVKLYSPDFEINHGGHSLKNKTNKFESVKLTKFDDLFKGKEKEIELVKIDVEGFELEVLNGMKNFLGEKKVKNIILEIDRENYDEIVSLLKKYNYSVKNIMYNNYLATLI